MQKYDAPAENVTTPSLAGLKAYSLGYRAVVVESNYAAAIPLFQWANRDIPKLKEAKAEFMKLH